MIVESNIQESGNTPDPSELAPLAMPYPDGVGKIEYQQRAHSEQIKAPSSFLAVWKFRTASLPLGSSDGGPLFLSEEVREHALGCSPDEQYADVHHNYMHERSLVPERQAFVGKLSHAKMPRASFR